MTQNHAWGVDNSVNTVQYFYLKLLSDQILNILNICAKFEQIL
jgi:hypothetical protein